jgi:hypothetical protein
MLSFWNPAGNPHTNSRGLVHGGLIAALADNAMGLSCGQGRQGVSQGLITVNLSVDYLGRHSRTMASDRNHIREAGQLDLFRAVFRDCRWRALRPCNATFKALRKKP